MTVLSLPGGIYPCAAQWSLEHNVGGTQNPLGNTIQRIQRDGGRWRADLTFPTLEQDEGALFAAYLDKASRGDKWTYITPPHADARGNWGPDELVSNGDFTRDVSGWSAGSGAALNVNARRLRVRVGGSPGAVATAVQTALATEADQPHVVMVDLVKGSTANWRIKLYPTGSPSQDEHVSYYEDEGRVVFVHIPETTSTTLELACNSSAEQDYSYFANASMARCLLVNDSLAVGSECDVKGGPTSQNGALKAGEFVTIQLWNGWQMVRLTEDLDTDSSGNGTLRFESSLRDGVKGGGAVIVHKPFCRMIVPSHASQHAVDMPRLFGFSVSYIEDVTEIGIEENPQDTDLIWLWDAHSYGLAPSVGSGTPSITNGGKAYVDQNGLVKFTALDDSQTGSPTPYLPAFDHDPDTGALRGMPVEEARTNEALWSRDFTRSSWTKTNMTAAQDETGEDGVEDSCSSLLATAANATATQAITSASSTARVFTLSIKRLIGSGTIAITLDSGANWLDVTSLVDDDGFTRASHVATLANPTVGIRLGTSGDKVAVDFAGESTGAFALSRILTTSATATRAADVITLATASIPGFSASTLTLYAEAAAGATSASDQYLFNIDDGTLSERHGLYRQSANVAGTATVDGGVVQLNVNAGAWASNATAKLAAAVAANDAALCSDGVVRGTDTAVTMPTVTTVWIGSRTTGVGQFNGAIRTLRLYKARKPNRQLMSMSA